MRKRIGSRLTSTYVDVYSEDLYQLLLRNAKELRTLKKNIRKIEKRLAELGYEATDLSIRVAQNLDFARANMKANIYDQAVLEGVATSFPQTEDIIDNGTVSGTVSYTHLCGTHRFRGRGRVPEAAGRRSADHHPQHQNSGGTACGLHARTGGRTDRPHRRRITGG